MAKKKEENVQAVETEEAKAKFQEKLTALLELGKKRKNILEYQEISDFFKDLNLDADVENPGKEKWGWKNGYFCAYLLVIVIFDG